MSRSFRSSKCVCLQTIKHCCQSVYDENTNLFWKYGSAVGIFTELCVSRLCSKCVDKGFRCHENANAEVHDTASELGKNASEAGKAILNNTAEAGKKIVGGAADVVSNISQEIKQGVGAK